MMSLFFCLCCRLLAGSSRHSQPMRETLRRLRRRRRLAVRHFALQRSSLLHLVLARCVPAVKHIERDGTQADKSDVSCQPGRTAGLYARSARCRLLTTIWTHMHAVGRMSLRGRRLDTHALRPFPGVVSALCSLPSLMPSSASRRGTCTRGRTRVSASRRTSKTLPQTGWRMRQALPAEPQHQWAACFCLS